ncbi:interleukin-18 receptor accessory protein-like isoform X2 [Paramormyrops kingsleyae]|uniref:Interleukin-18 receptor accessory protein-like n=1 Tax=Paramormyrops kingsleyae TaxID=1676925 RepID=A0A3B3SN26_9TELE|nr:interleukin-18 receptor accessory protein-like [Paramormyrops kingsleyae]XP_023684621.1 interleukin-18 receptor accessory protein-like [Paramormyrops kingsleyae]XP_023684622.1 interleukin-18 receptor accessory protein-like [Paramormyrops kingsleyae]XP_023684624.1 interleukin-18 receptor accessory protein-like [Paramormyrops kingsleyae]
MCCGLTLAVVIFGLLRTQGVSSGSAPYGYKALAGEGFLLQCASPYQPVYLFDQSKRIENSVIWLKHKGHTNETIPGQDGTIAKQGNYLNFTVIEERHAGNYSCYNGSKMLSFILDVMPRNGTDCRVHGDSEVTLIVGRGGRIQCPGVHCYTKASKVNIRWYKENEYLTRAERGLDIEGTELKLYTVYVGDHAMFTCDVSHMDGMMWTVRRSVRVTVIQDERDILPRILYPYEDCTEETELGKAKNLTCKVQFPFERTFQPVIKWFVSYGGYGSEELLNSEIMGVQPSFGEHTTTQVALLHKVTERDLDATFTCFAQNSIGNVSTTMRLRRKLQVGELVLVIIGPVVALVFVTGVSVLVRAYWLEILLLYRMYLPFPDAIAVGKEYDAFVSYVSGSSSENEEADLTGELLGLHHFPQVLEQQWGYRLFLLERDLIPGGAYTEEVVKSIQRSRMIICLLSSLYLRSPCLFELETGLKILKDDPHFRIVLVWSGRPPRKLPALLLPHVVRRALRVLPAICHPTRDLSQSDSKFWKTLRMKMPQTRMCVSSCGEDV